MCLFAPSPAVGGDGLFEIFVFLAREAADPPQSGEMFLGFGEVVDDQVGLSDILVSTAMSRVQLQRALVVAISRVFGSAPRCRLP